MTLKRVKSGGVAIGMERFPEKKRPLLGCTGHQGKVLELDYTI